jgi:hypothetical protein
MELQIKIKFGNDAMQTPADAVYALGRFTARAEDDFEPVTGADEGKLFDLNGNTVGTWEYVDVAKSLTTTLSTGYKLYPDSNETGEELKLIGDDGMTREELFTTTDPRSFRELGEALIRAAAEAEAEAAERKAIASRVSTTTARIETEGMF